METNVKVLKDFEFQGFKILEVGKVYKINKYCDTYFYNFIPQREDKIIKSEGTKLMIPKEILEEIKETL